MAGFKLEIITPEKMFFNGTADEIVCRTVEGELGVLKGHQPMIAVLDAHNLKLKIDGEWKTAYVSDGFVEVRPDEVVIFGEYCDWAEDAERAKAERERLIEAERRRHGDSILQQRHDTISIARSMMSLGQTDLLNKGGNGKNQV